MSIHLSPFEMKEYPMKPIIKILLVFILIIPIVMITFLTLVQLKSNTTLLLREHERTIDLSLDSKFQLMN